MKKLDVLYTTDKNYINQLLVSIASLCDKNRHIEKIRLHIIYDKFTFNDFFRIVRLLNNYKNVQLELYNFESIKQLIKKHEIPDWRGTSIANARLFFDHVISNVDHILYLDSDTIIANKLDGLECYDSAICMAEDEMPTDYIQELDRDIDTYYNSGVIWINVDKWKEEKCEEKIIETLKTRKDFIYPDQDLLNVTFKNKIETLHPAFNVYPPDIYYGRLSLRKYFQNIGVERKQINNMRTAVGNSVILHSTTFGHWRAWHKSNNIHPYEKTYRFYSETIQEESMQTENEYKPGNKIMYRIINYAKLYTPREIKDQMKRLLYK